MFSFQLPNMDNKYYIQMYFYKDAYNNVNVEKSCYNKNK